MLVFVMLVGLILISVGFLELLLVLKNGMGIGLILL